MLICRTLLQRLLLLDLRSGGMLLIKAICAIEQKLVAWVYHHQVGVIFLLWRQFLKMVLLMNRRAPVEVLIVISEDVGIRC